MNVWSHLIGFFVFLYLMIADNLVLLPALNASLSDRVVISVALVCYQVSPIVGRGNRLKRHARVFCVDGTCSGSCPARIRSSELKVTLYIGKKSSASFRCDNRTDRRGETFWHPSRCICNNANFIIRSSIIVHITARLDGANSGKFAAHTPTVQPRTATFRWTWKITALYPRVADLHAVVGWLPLVLLPLGECRPPLVCHRPRWHLGRPHRLLPARNLLRLLLLRGTNARLR